jgi:hypothetical protein
MIQVTINSQKKEVLNAEEFLDLLRSTNHMPFRELSLSHKGDKASMTVLMNGLEGFLLYMASDDDAGFTSRNPIKNSPTNSKQFRLTNGQMDQYPDDWVVAQHAIEEACVFFCNSKAMLPTMMWHDDR